ncbi:MAG: glutathione S-transferase family protein [Pseudomonadota bacterium]
MKLYNGDAANPRRVRIFLVEKGIEADRIDFDVVAGATRTPDFLKKNSLGHVPILELDDGTVITESHAICRYFEEVHPDPPLFGTDARQKALIEMWNRRLEIELLMTLGAIAQHSFRFFSTRLRQVPAYADAQRETAVEKWIWLDGELSDGRPYAAGEAFSVADITGMTALHLSAVVDAECPPDLPHVNAWAARLRSRPSWLA